MTKLTVAVVALLGMISCSEILEISGPVFEAFAPAGLRVSMPEPDTWDRVSVWFEIGKKPDNVSDADDSGEENDTSDQTYWNPKLKLKLDEEIHYLIKVEKDGRSWSREGVHVVDKVLPLTDEDFDMDDSTREKRDAVRTVRRTQAYSGGDHDHANGGTASSYRYSYSSRQSSGSKPIIRSSTSNTTGIFVVKPDGEVETSGYKTSSRFDSTKDEGKQWEFSESELGPEELRFDEFKPFIAPDFSSFSDQVQQQFQESRTYPPERLYSSLPQNVNSPSSARSYESPSAARGNKPYPKQPPLPSPSSSSSSSSFQQQQSRSYEYTSGGAKPAYYSPPPSDSQKIVPASFSSTSYQQQSYGQKPAVSSRNYEYSGSQSQWVSSNQATNRPATQTNPSPSYLSSSVIEKERGKHREVEKPREKYEFDSDDDQTEKPKYSGQSRYVGSFFGNPETYKITKPEDCSAWAESHYDTSTYILRVQKSISKINCLASIAEVYATEELKQMKRQHSELSMRVDFLENEFKRYIGTCRCTG